MANNAFPLEFLPPELLRRVCEYALPQGVKLSFSLWSADRQRWTVFAAHGNHEPCLLVKLMLPHMVPKCKTCDKHCRFSMEIVENWSIGLLRVNKAIANEARAAFFAGNTVAISIRARPKYPVSLKPPAMFGPLGSPQRIHLLRDLRNIELTVHIDENSYYAAYRHRTRIQYFVEIIRAHAEDKSQRSLLTRLDVHLVDHYNYERRRPGDLPLSQEAFDRHMFALESLAQITGIFQVSFGGVPAWFAQCLETRARGDGGEIKPLDWPKRTMKRKDENGIVRRIPKRQSWQPLLDWKDFAERNGIDLPEDTVRFFSNL